LLNNDHLHKGFAQGADPNGGYVLFFKDSPVCTQVEAEALGSEADIIWERFLKYRLNQQEIAAAESAEKLKAGIALFAAAGVSAATAAERFAKLRDLICGPDGVE
jgi:hypothetical protein